MQDFIYTDELGRERLGIITVDDIEMIRAFGFEKWWDKHGKEKTDIRTT